MQRFCKEATNVNQIIIFSTNVNKTVSLINLLNLEQNNSSLFDFMIEIKNALMLNTNIPANQRNKLAVEVFLEGLSDKSISKAVSLQCPETIDQAFKLAKSVEKENEPQINQLAGSKENLSDEVRQLQKQVAYLTHLVLALRRQNNFQQGSLFKNKIKVLIIPILKQIMVINT